MEHTYGWGRSKIEENQVFLPLVVFDQWKWEQHIFLMEGEDKIIRIN